MDITLRLQLHYAPEARSEIRGWYLPCAELKTWLATAANESTSTTKFYLAPRSLADRTADGLIALRESDQLRKHALNHEAFACPAGAIPLVCLQEHQRDFELWLPLFSRLMPEVPLAELLSSQHWDGAKRLVWLPPDPTGQDRLIRVEVDDELDMSVLLKLSTQSSLSMRTTWQAPPMADRLPDRVTGLQIHRELLGPNPFAHEQQAIGAASDDLMSLDEDGRTSGGGMSARAGRWFRKQLSDFMETLNKRRQTKSQGSSSSKPKGASPGSSSKPKGASPGSTPKPSFRHASAYLYQHLQKLVADQREKQLKKLLSLMSRDPDRALKYALPMSQHGAPRGLAPPGNKLSRNMVDFSLAGLFGGGQPSDPWQLNAQLQAQLMAAYRHQAEREQAAGRYRRAAYIYGHLMGDLNSAAAMLEKGKFFVEAAALYEHLHRPADQARCLRGSGQLTEAAVIYERLENFETAAEMWSSVGDQTSARAAWERAYEAALKRYDILKAVNILEMRLEDTARAESLLWQQWPRGHQVFECTLLAFQRLAAQGRVADAHTHLTDVVSRAEPDQQTLLAKLCCELYRSSPDREFRIRVEDQCRVSAVDRLRMLSNSQLAQRMQILSSLHTDDTLLQRDTRRFEREFKNSELQLQPDTAQPTERGKLKALPSARLAAGVYSTAVMIRQQMFTISSVDGGIHCSRYAQLTHEVPVGNHSWTDLKHWNASRPNCCYVQSDSDPLIIHVGYLETRPEPMLLVSPLGGDDFWVIHTLGAEDGQLYGVSDDGDDWRWDRQRYAFTCRRGSSFQLTDFGPLIRPMLLRQLHAYGVEEVLAAGDMNTAAQRQVLMLAGQPFIAYRDTIMSVENGEPIEIATLSGQIGWMVPSLPLTLPRLLVATENCLWMVSTSRGARPEKIMQDEQFTSAAFLPGGRVAAVTKRELFLFQRGSQAMRLIDRRELLTPHVCALLSITAETLGVLYAHGVLERYRIT